VEEGGERVRPARLAEQDVAVLAIGKLQLHGMASNFRL
jgi:hypothetical protein